MVMTAVTPIAAPSADAPAANAQKPASDNAVVFQQATPIRIDSVTEVPRPADPAKPVEADVAVPVVS
jgi:hypothetical protein